MRILHVTDTHLGARWALSGAPPDLRARDHERALELALAPACREEVDLVLHSGDLFDRSHPDRVAIAAAHRLLSEVARRVPVVVVAGNHDRRGVCAALAEVAGVRVFDAPARIVVAGVSLALVPHQRTAEAFAHAIGGLEPSDLVVAHQSFAGHRVPGFTFRVGRPEETVGEQHLPRWVGPVACGHLHPRQVVRVGGAEIVCPGSTERTSFVEADQTKGYARWELGAAAHHRFVDLPTRPLVVVRHPGDLDRVVPGAIARASEGREAEIRARGAYCAVERSQLALFDQRPRRIRSTAGSGVTSGPSGT